MDFKHGGDVYSAALAWGVEIEQVHDFSANINPFGLELGVLEGLSKQRHIFEHYPDTTYKALKSAIANHYGLRAEEILVGNGGIELIYKTIQASKPSKIGILAPTFIEYERAALSYGCEVAVMLTEPYGFKVPLETLTTFAKGVDLLFICNPNNPTAVLYKREFLIALALACPNTYLVIDEAFIEFVEGYAEYTVIHALDTLPNVSVIRSMTKAFSMPGLRLGFMVTGSKFQKNELELALNPWNVNGFVAVYTTEILKLLKGKPFQAEVFRPLRTEMIQALNKMPCMEVLESQVNYIFCRYSGEIDLQIALNLYHILIRDCSNYKGLKKGDYRIAVRTHSENMYVISCLNSILGEKSC